MELLVVGGTGTLGRQIVRRAIDAGHSVRCLVRNPRKASFLQEWGAKLIQGDLCDPETLAPALDGVETLIDAATTRATDSLRIRQVDWDGKVALIQAAKAAKIKRYIFFSILNAEHFPNVPLMEMKHCTEKYLAEVGMDYTILRPCGFMQGLIGQYAVPILDNQVVWITGLGSAIAYMDTLDIAKFAIRAAETPAAANRTLPVVGPRAWGAYEIIRLCERLAGQTAKTARLELPILRIIRAIVRSFQWGYNVSDRLAFAEVLASETPLDAPMAETYQLLDLDPAETTTLEAYLQEYFSRIMSKLKEIGYEKEKEKKRRKKKNIKAK
ncbi:NmrA family NAD(P)-binding protein [Spirulina major]|uniref:NmrA family NAD(P)-binding protein n=1 Tax=Spirulina major TaxID=270636 RepID=UPI0009339ECB|nr:NmrA family NAD(P)-binding protein [Spirulina major]